MSKQLHRKGFRRHIFIDGGGNDGCSVIKFLLMRPRYQCVSFEPNPELAKFYKWLPGDLIAQGLSSKTERKVLYLDTDDADGSTVIESKPVYFGQSKRDAEQRIEISCISIVDFLRSFDPKTDYIVLKLDVEGSEYEILEAILRNEMLEYLNELHIEFHSNRMPGKEEQEKSLRKSFEPILAADTWNAQPLRLYKKGLKALSLRAYCLFWIYFARMANMDNIPRVLLPLPCRK